jgi:hypothetical protein
MSKGIRKLPEQFQFGRLSVVPGSKFKHRTSHITQNKNANCVKHTVPSDRLTYRGPYK